MGDITLTREWDEAEPDGSEPANTIDDIIRDLKVDIRERAEIEQEWDSATDNGRHKEGSARCSVDTLANIIANRGSSALEGAGGNEEGRMFYASDKRTLYVSDGTNWIPVSAVPTGVIMLWSGSIASIPTGWLICDGTNGTPNLRGRFVVGYNAAETEFDAVGETGGSKTRTLTITELPAHTHAFANSQGGTSLGQGPYIQGATGAPNYNLASATTTTQGSGQAFSILPPYYALAYIMKS